MCGIAGIIDFAGRPIDQQRLDRCCAALAHRGPDDRGTWQHQQDGFSVGLAHTRLAVIEPSPVGRQPMLDDTGRRAVVYNGELYNYRLLGKQLAQPPHSQCDTEVALRTCIERGLDALSAFDAMYALAYVDTEKRSGFLARDPFGIKPLFYMLHDRRLCFASELGTLKRLTDAPLEIDPQAQALYLHLGFIPHPRTIYRNVFKLSPGHYLAFDADGCQPPQRYHYLTDPFHETPSYPEACALIRRQIHSAVARQRVADVPLGAFLSGGLDSSIIVAALARASDQPIKTFSIGYAEHSHYDETDYARQVARQYGTDHHEFRLTFDDILAGIDPMLERMAEPFADSSLLPTALVSHHTRQAVTVALSGDGGDELFGGYWRYVGHHYLERYYRLPRFIRKKIMEPLLHRCPAAKSSRLLNKARQVRKMLRGDFPDPLDRHLAWASHLDEKQAADLLGQSVAMQTRSEMERLYTGAAPDLHRIPRLHLLPLEQILLADLAIGLPDDMLFKVDTASMAHSLEVRVPLLSTDLVDTITHLPLEYRIDGANGKRILRDAFAPDLPAAILNRPKMGFEVPIGEFLRNELKSRYRDTVTPANLRELQLDPDTAARLYDDHLHRRDEHADLLWTLLVLCHWKENQH